MIIDKTYPDLNSATFKRYNQYIKGYQINHALVLDEDLTINLDGPLHVDGDIRIKGNFISNVSVEVRSAANVVIDGDVNVTDLFGNIDIKIGGNLKAHIIDCFGIIVDKDVTAEEICAYFVAIKGNATLNVFNVEQQLIVGENLHANKIWGHLEDDPDNDTKTWLVEAGQKIRCKKLNAYIIHQNVKNIKDSLNSCIAEINREYCEK